MNELRRSLILGTALLTLTVGAHAQTFSSGSTGADGALNCPSTCQVQLPESGILNYTTVNIASGQVLAFKPNRLNTPVIILAQADVIIAGQVSVSAPGNLFSPQSSPTADTPGPGGFRGGAASGENGYGPGGGQGVTQGTPGNGRWVGPLALVPIIGGSGGGGAGASSPGGGGGGAIVIASSTSIQIAGSGGIFASGLTWYSTGSGGAIRLVANSLSISGSLSAQGLKIGDNGFSVTSVPGTNGVVRLEAPSGGLNYTGSSSPPAVLADISSPILPTNAPALSIVSIGGITVPSHSGSRLDSIDVLLPLTLSEPINVVVQGTSIPVGTQVTIQQSTGTSSTCSLSGSLSSSSATCSIANVNRSVITYILAVAVFDPPASAQLLNPRGRNHVAKIRIESIPGGEPRYVFLRENGAVIPAGVLPKKFLERFGM